MAWSVEYEEWLPAPTTPKSFNGVHLIGMRCRVRQPASGHGDHVVFEGWDCKRKQLSTEGRGNAWDEFARRRTTDGQVAASTVDSHLLEEQEFRSCKHQVKLIIGCC